MWEIFKNRGKKRLITLVILGITFMWPWILLSVYFARISNVFITYSNILKAASFDVKKVQNLATNQSDEYQNFLIQ